MASKYVVYLTDGVPTLGTADSENITEVTDFVTANADPDGSTLRFIMQRGASNCEKAWEDAGGTPE